jgi:uncharacterized glyoxalase superfamily protein PhnB
VACFKIKYKIANKPLGGRRSIKKKIASEEELRYAYNLLIQEGTEYSIVLDGWAPLIALVRDKFGVHWFFYFE